MKRKLLFEQYHKGRQSVEYRAVYAVRDDQGNNPKKIRIEIDRDTYDFQSSAVAKVYSEGVSKWEYLASIPYRNMAALAANAYSDRLTHHEPDVEELLKQSASILF